MALRKRCAATLRPVGPNSELNPLYCPASPRCGHHWFYDFRVNGRRYRSTTETADKHQARNIEARERSRILEGRHGIRRQLDITFREFAKLYLRDHAELHKRSVVRDREIIKVLDRSFGAVLLHELTAHRIEQFKRTRLTGRWRGYHTTSPARPIKPATVNRELDTLKSMLSKAVAWGKLIENPARGVRRLKVANRQTRILTEDEQRRLLEAYRGKLRAVVTLALITAARGGELLSLRWDECRDGVLTFMETKNGTSRRIPISPAINAVLSSQSRVTPWVFVNGRTGKPFTVNGIAHVFARAVNRAGIVTGDVTLPHAPAYRHQPDDRQWR